MLVLTHTLTDVIVMPAVKVTVPASPPEEPPKLGASVPKATPDEKAWTEYRKPGLVA